jgi:hypothetical protein
MNHLVLKILLLCCSLSGSAALAVEDNPITLKVFTEPVVGIPLCNGMRGPRGIDEMREERRKLERQKVTLKAWLTGSSIDLKRQDQKFFEKWDVSYLITFPGKSDMGTATLVQGSSAEANSKAADLLQKLTPLSRPPDDFPYDRGLLIKFRGSKMWVHLAPTHTQRGSRD